MFVKLHAIPPADPPPPGPVLDLFSRDTHSKARALRRKQPSGTLKPRFLCQGGRVRRNIRGADPQFQKAARLVDPDGARSPRRG